MIFLVLVLDVAIADLTMQICQDVKLSTLSVLPYLMTDISAHTPLSR